MKNLIKSVIFSSLFLLHSFAYADEKETNDINNQNLSKRPYQKKSSNLKNDDKNSEGANFLSESEALDKKFKVLRLNMLSKRPYVQNSSE